MAERLTRTTKTVTIANGASLSDAADLGPNETTICAIVMPASWTAAALTFQASVDGTTYYDLFSSGGTETNFTVAATRVVVVDPNTFSGARYVKVRSGAAGAAVNQGADRVLTLHLRSLS